jgi:hypothetical protein
VLERLISDGPIGSDIPKDHKKGSGNNKKDV